jgi:predicted phage tail protein
MASVAHVQKLKKDVDDHFQRDLDVMEHRHAVDDELRARAETAEAKLENARHLIAEMKRNRDTSAAKYEAMVHQSIDEIEDLNKKLGEERVKLQEIRDVLGK